MTSIRGIQTPSPSSRRDSPRTARRWPKRTSRLWSSSLRPSAAGTPPALSARHSVGTTSSRGTSSRARAASWRALRRWPTC
eukprot:8134917-Pyramimonas_sp.AAC.1